MIATIITTLSIIGLSWLAYLQIGLNRATGDVFRVLVDAFMDMEQRLDNQEAVIRTQQKMIEELQKPTAIAE